MQKVIVAHSRRQVEDDAYEITLADMKRPLSTPNPPEGETTGFEEAHDNNNKRG